VKWAKLWEDFDDSRDSEEDTEQSETFYDSIWGLREGLICDEDNVDSGAGQREIKGLLDF
jgi:hypothetical protein